MGCVGKIPSRRLREQGIMNFRYLIKNFNGEDRCFTIFPILILTFHQTRILCEEGGSAKLPVPQNEKGFNKFRTRNKIKI